MKTSTTYKSFKIYPWSVRGDCLDKKRWFVFRCFPTTRRMYKHFKEHHGKAKCDFRAMCIGRIGKRSGCIGNILISYPYLRLGVIAHECAHAAFVVCGNVPHVKRGWCDRKEERYAHVLGWFVSQALVGCKNIVKPLRGK